MLNNKKVIIVMPAFNAEATLKKTYNDIPDGFCDEIILVDDCSKDETVRISKELGIKTIVHSKNLGYGANQKTCYKEALNDGADIVVMLHPDYQYDPKLALSLASIVAYGDYDCAIASRFHVNSAKKSKMPRYKYFSNRFLTTFQNLLLDRGLSEYHTGYRVFSREVLEKINFEEFEDGFIFDNQMLASIYYNNFLIGEISTPCRYFDEASSIKLKESIKYGFGVLGVSVRYFFAKIGIKNSIFK